MSTVIAAPAAAGPLAAQPVRAQAILSRVCCGWPSTAFREGRWRLFVACLDGSTDWPEHQWPVSRRHVIPTVAEREKALTALGWAAAPDARWQWEEDETSAEHGHPVRVHLIAAIPVLRLPERGRRA
ncbi:DUF6303 family protein [Streptomyces huiliensis]|uniref:DUF6303 family protein n=1 Tax=Streptomyces huiliensis TaxID=2876027 RepID=UPI001CBCDBA5|nr:DUF6303 family protein [Streptomyces huiliensis]MBZ4322478.1 DUF6303 family protein [Streptomyces huiliensis]